MRDATVRTPIFAESTPFDAAMARAVSAGLSAPHKYLPSTLFYDDYGSRLFQQITALPEYYLTRAEQEILESQLDILVANIAPTTQPIDLIELGSGDGVKTITLCEALQQRYVDCTYHPVDISALALDELAKRFIVRLPGMKVRPLCGDYNLAWPATGSSRRRVAMMLGSNLGNFSFQQRIALLRRVRNHLREGDRLMLGLDLVKDPRLVLAAYDDAQGVTARFNLNLLTRLNREMQMNFRLSQFTHYASYSPLDAAAHSFLISSIDQTVYCRELKRSFNFAVGESIFTERSQKFSQTSILETAKASGFSVLASVNDSRDFYTLSVWCPVVDS